MVIFDHFIFAQKEALRFCCSRIVGRVLSQGGLDAGDFPAVGGPGSLRTGRSTGFTVGASASLMRSPSETPLGKSACTHLAFCFRLAPLPSVSFCFSGGLRLGLIKHGCSTSAPPGGLFRNADQASRLFGQTINVAVWISTTQNPVSPPGSPRFGRVQSRNRIWNTGQATMYLRLHIPPRNIRAQAPPLQLSLD